MGEGDCCSQQSPSPIFSPFKNVTPAALPGAVLFIVVEKNARPPQGASPRYCSFFASSSLTRAGLALPLVARMICPTKKLMSLVLPPL